MPIETRVIELTPTKAASGTTWQLCTETKCDNKPPYPMLDLKKDTGPYTILFSINDSSSSPIKFPNKADDAIHIQPNSKPNGKKYDPGGQLGVSAHLTKNKQTLILTDKNDGSGVDFHYALNFSDGSTIDPVIRNGGGTNPPAPPKKYDFGLGEPVALLIGLIVGALLARIWLNRRRSTGVS